MLSRRSFLKRTAGALAAVGIVWPERELLGRTLVEPDMSTETKSVALVGDGNTTTTMMSVTCSSQSSTSLPFEPYYGEVLDLSDWDVSAAIQQDSYQSGLLSVAVGGSTGFIPTYDTMERATIRASKRFKNRIWFRDNGDPVKFIYIDKINPRNSFRGRGFIVKEKIVRENSLTDFTVHLEICADGPVAYGPGEEYG